MEKIIIETIGYVGVILNTLSTLPQLIKTYHTKDVNGISMNFILLWAIACGFLTIYAWLTLAPIPTLVNYALNVLFPGLLLIMYFKYRNK